MERVKWPGGRGEAGEGVEVEGRTSMQRPAHRNLKIPRCTFVMVGLKFRPPL